MRHSRYLFSFACIIPAFSLIWSSGCARQEAPKLTPDSPQVKAFAPLPGVVESSKNPVTEEKIVLGRMLYYDARLSKGHDVSCNSCHQLDNYGVDGKATSDGHKAQKGDRNSPTVYNAAGHFVQFWDGRAADVEEQAKGPVMNPVEMAMPSEDCVAGVLHSMPEYVAAFKAAFPDDEDPVTYDNMAKAIGAFERKLLTPARWDQFLRGDSTALSDAELAGLNEFLTANCQACHMGPYLGGNIFQKLGVVKPWPDTSDAGRYKVTANEADKMMFKVPSLRNIAKTGPYFHGGGVPILSEAVSTMAEYQLGKQLVPAQVDSIVTFLETLTGNIPADYIRPPELPEATARTPKPDLSD